MVDEVPEAANSSIQSLASCSQSHSERDLHKVVAKFELALPIQLTDVPIGKGVTVPILPLSHWVV